WGVAGELEPVPPSGPWATPASVNQLYQFYDLGPGGCRLRSERTQPLQEAAERGTATDLRHVTPFLWLLTRGLSPLAEAVVREVLPFSGPALLPDRRAEPPRHVYCLLGVYRIDRAAGLAAAHRFLEGWDGLMGLLPRFGPPVVRAFVEELDQLKSFPTREDLE